MKKVITIISGIVLAITLILSGSFTSAKAYAADESAKYIKGARFLTALHGQDENDREIVVALYEKKGENIAYVNDGIAHVYTGYTTKDTTMKNIGPVQRVTVGDVLVYNFFLLDDETPCLITDDGTIYVCEYVDSATVSGLQKLD